MKCRKCGSELDSDSVFCPECGTRVERPVENNSGDIVRDNVNSGTTAERENRLYLRNGRMSFEEIR